MHIQLYVYLYCSLQFIFTTKNMKKKQTVGLIILPSPSVMIPGNSRVNAASYTLLELLLELQQQALRYLSYYLNYSSRLYVT